MYIFITNNKQTFSLFNIIPNSDFTVVAEKNFWAPP